MANIVNINDLIGEDTTIVYGDQEFIVSSDLDTELVFRMWQAYRVSLQVQANPDSTSAKVASAKKQLEDTVLQILRAKQPELESLPFGVRSMPIVIEHILRAIGIVLKPGEDDDADPPTQTGESRSPTKSDNSSQRPRTRRKTS